MQCDKRNNYRRKVKEEKAAKTGGEGEEGDVSVDGVKDGNTSTITNGDAGVDEDGERPIKKLKAENGDAVLPDAGDDADDDGGEDEDDNDEDGEDGEDDGGEDDVPDEEESDEEDQPMEDALEEQSRRGSMRDEALDDPDSE